MDNLHQANMELLLPVNMALLRWAYSIQMHQPDTLERLQPSINRGLHQGNSLMWVASIEME